MIGPWLAAIFARDLRALQRELEAYPREADLWRVVPGMPNSAGNLALHLTGNLLHFVGAQLGKTGYLRNRDAEFASKDVPQGELLVKVLEAVKVVEEVLPQLSDGDLEREYPQSVAGVRVRTGDFLLHLVAHFGYHLGQLDYHRRVVTGEQKGVGAVPVPELATAAKP